MKSDPRTRDEELADRDNPSGLVGPDSGGQSGDMQGLSSIAQSADESVEELADSGQDYEAEAVQGVEDAGDHPEQPVTTYLERGRRAERKD